MRHFLAGIFIVFVSSCQTGDNPQQEAAKILPHNSIMSLQDSLQIIVSSAKAHVGIAVVGPGGGCAINGEDQFRMMSVAKFPQALLLLHWVDEGKMDANEKIRITEHDLLQRTGSSIVKDHPEKSFDLTIREVLDYSVGQSDNVTSNVMFEKVGGPKAVESYVRSLGITGIGIGVDYWNLNAETADSNWSTPLAMVDLLEKFYSGNVLTGSNRNLLWDVMTKGPTGMNRIRAGLPEGTVLGHKTGTGGTDERTGRNIAFNDVGIVVLPDGKHFSIAVFIEDSYESEDQTALLISKLTRQAWNYYVMHESK